MDRSRCARGAAGSAPVNILCAPHHSIARLVKISAPSEGGESKSNLTEALGLFVSLTWKLDFYLAKCSIKTFMRLRSCPRELRTLARDTTYRGR